MNNKWMLSGTLLLAFSATAQNKKPLVEKGKPVVDSVNESIGGQGYGLAGCGLGSIVFGQKPGFVQVFAATTNGTFNSQMFGITTGTLNCKGAMNTAAAEYVESNRVALAREAARGEGETVAGLSKIMGCQNTQGFGKAIQRAYPAIFGDNNASADQMANAIQQAVRNDNNLASSCS